MVYFLLLCAVQWNSLACAECYENWNGLQTSLGWVAFHCLAICYVSNTEENWKKERAKSTVLDDYAELFMGVLVVWNLSLHPYAGFSMWATSQLDC